MPITSTFAEDIKGKARQCSYLIIFLLLFFAAIDHDTSGDEKSSHFLFVNSLSMILIKGLCFIQLSLTLFYCYLWGKMRATLSLEKYYQSAEDDENIGDLG